MTGSGGARCAVHLSRPAADACPVCERPRCAADAVRYGSDGCAACTDLPTVSAVPVPPLERLVRAALAALGAALVGGTIAAQYVDAELFAYLAPAVVGAACGAAAQAAAGESRGAAGPGRTGAVIRAVAAGVAALGVGLGFLLEGSRDPVSPGAAVPELLAVLGAVLWTLPPRGTRRAKAGRAG